MESVFCQYCSGSVMFTFAPKTTLGENEVLLLADKVGVWVDRNTREVIGADAYEYYFNHAERSFPSALMQSDEAACGLSPWLEVSSSRLALLPLGDGTETLCWEFRSSFSGGEYLVYLDAESGDEVSIMRCICDESGSYAE
ncbi:MAG: hypothetical protein IK064_00960 [Clostridia bacterium]|nr:hypothetical protein [Clostridia bacterium]